MLPDKLFIEEDFDKAIEISKIVQNLAQEVNDVTLIKNIENIMVATTRLLRIMPRA